MKDRLRVSVNVPRKKKKKRNKESAPDNPRSIDQNSNINPRVYGQTSIFGLVFSVCKSLVGIKRRES